ncbi:MAG: DUF262 domain-containing protein [Alistipes sp.]|nr:DUF262 domain-containing protein [Alistipes sp.]
MKIELIEITIRDLTENYSDNQDDGVTGYAGRLDIRPPYQREFIYKDKQRSAVVDTVMKGFPLNVMYWAVKQEGSYEVIDGQQRTISICQYVEGDFSFDNRYFHNLRQDEKSRILDYKLMVYLCTGSDSEKLEWFKTINIAGLKLKDQELHNAVYAGSFVTHAKKHFSKKNSPAHGLAGQLLEGEASRQDYLETAIKWISNGDITGYMATHQHDANANELWLYFQSVINWVKILFPKYRKEMKGIDWGFLYNDYKDSNFDSAALEEQVASLMMDEDVTNKKGIYLYVLNGKEKHLNIRAFTDRQKREAYERQGGICPKCGNHFTEQQMEADHITPWHEGGRTEAANCQMLCREDNRRKSGK